MKAQTLFDDVRTNASFLSNYVYFSQFDKNIKMYRETFLMILLMFVYIRLYPKYQQSYMYNYTL